MIKAAADTKDGKLLLLGLSEKNIIMLKKDKPVLINPDQLEELTSWKGNILILYNTIELGHKYMVRASTDTEKGKMLILGLTNEGILQLKNNMVIKMESDQLKKLTGWKGCISIIYGETEEKMKNMLSDFLPNDYR